MSYGSQINKNNLQWRKLKKKLGYVLLSNSKPNESIRWQSHKLGVFQTVVGGLRGWHRSWTSSTTSLFGNPSLSYGERLSWDIFKPRVDSWPESKRDRQFKSLGSIFQAKNKCGQREISVQLATQSSEEGIDEFVNQLRKMASSCKYGTLTDEMIRDRIVIGVRNKATKLRLLKEEELDLNKALSICRSNEVASKQVNSMKQEEIQTWASQRHGQSNKTTRQAAQRKERRREWKAHKGREE